MLTLVKQQRYKSLRWKNNKGTTDEIAIAPANADFIREDFDYRISTARIETSGEFSVFKDYDRILVLLEGNGVQLAHRDDSQTTHVTLLCGTPYSFSGAVTTHCTLIDGAVTDLNILTRSGVVSASTEIQAIQPGASLTWQAPESKSLQSLAFVMNGSIVTGGAAAARSHSPDQELVARSGDTLIYNPTGSTCVDLTNAASLPATILFITVMRL